MSTEDIKAKIKEIETGTERLLIALTSSFYRKPTSEAQRENQMINPNDLSCIVNSLKEDGSNLCKWSSKNGVDLLLTTQGGYLYSAIGIIDTLKKKFKKNVRVIAPYHVGSAAAVMAFSADEFYHTEKATMTEFLNSSALNKKLRNKRSAIERSLQSGNVVVDADIEDLLWVTDNIHREFGHNKDFTIASFIEVCKLFNIRVTSHPSFNTLNDEFFPNFDDEILNLQNMLMKEVKTRDISKSLYVSNFWTQYATW